MSPVLELVRLVEENGGRIRIDGSDLVISPREAALPVLEELRRYKAEIVALIQSVTGQATDAEPDGDALPGEWLLDRCIYRDRCWGGIGALYLDASRWCAEHTRPAPESRRAFVAALQAEGFAVTTDGLVYGLMLAEDWEAHQRFQNPPAVAPAQRRRRA